MHSLYFFLPGINCNSLNHKMNRFWGRNEEGLSPKFTRDDDQILALNYENLCDADYLNRLFVAEDANQTSQDLDFMTESGDPQIGSNQVGSSLFSSELSEDLMIFGDSSDLSKFCFDKRFNKEISSTSKNLDSITTLINKQIIVFEHVGRLMVDRCSKSITVQDTSVPDKEVKNPNENIGRHLVSESLPSALSILLQKLSNNTKNDRNQFTFKKSTMEALLSVLFQICDESISIGGTSNTLMSSRSFNPSLLHTLREMLTSCIFSSLNFATNRDQPVLIYSSSQLVEENLKLSFSCFYGLLLLG